MSSSKKYNPFTAEGRYNLELWLYSHKNIVLGITVLMITILSVIIYYVSKSNGTTSDSFGGPKIEMKEIKNIPRPRYGYGPYGPGLYAPPRAFFEKPPTMIG